MNKSESPGWPRWSRASPRGPPPPAPGGQRYGITAWNTDHGWTQFPTGRPALPGRHRPALPRPARGSQAERSQRSAYTMTNCNSQNASGHAASASVTEDGPFPRSPREISASRYPSCSSGRRGRGLGVSANQSRSRSLHGNHLLQLLQRCGVAAAA